MAFVKLPLFLMINYLKIHNFHIFIDQNF